MVGVCRRKKRLTTQRDPSQPSAPDRVQRNSQADGPNQLWVADISYVPTRAGFLYLALVVDAWSRRIVGWSMRDHLRTDLVLAALEMAIQARRPRGVIHHSDHGCQYTSLAFGQRCQQAGIELSMGSVGDCYDNALCESVNATLECVLIDRSDWADGRVASLAIFDFIESFYNHRRRHRALGQLSPDQFERRHADDGTPPAATLNPPGLLEPSGSSSRPHPL